MASVPSPLHSVLPLIYRRAKETIWGDWKSHPGSESFCLLAGSYREQVKQPAGLARRALFKMEGSVLL